MLVLLIYPNYRIKWQYVEMNYWGKVTNTLNNFAGNSNNLNAQELQIELKRSGKIIKEMEAQINKLKESTEFANRQYEQLEAITQTEKSKMIQIREISQKCSEDLMDHISGLGSQICAGFMAEVLDSIGEQLPQDRTPRLEITADVSCLFSEKISNFMIRYEQNLTSKQEIENKKKQLESKEIEITKKIHEHKEQSETIIKQLKLMLEIEQKKVQKYFNELKSVKLSQESDQKKLFAKCEELKTENERGKRLKKQLQQNSMHVTKLEKLLSQNAKKLNRLPEVVNVLQHNRQSIQGLQNQLSAIIEEVSEFKQCEADQTLQKFNQLMMAYQNTSFNRSHQITLQQLNRINAQMQSRLNIHQILVKVNERFNQNNRKVSTLDNKLAKLCSQYKQNRQTSKQKDESINSLKSRIKELEQVSALQIQNLQAINRQLQEQVQLQKQEYLSKVTQLQRVKQELSSQGEKSIQSQDQSIQPPDSSAIKQVEQLTQLVKDQNIEIMEVRQHKQNYQSQIITLQDKISQLTLRLSELSEKEHVNGVQIDKKSQKIVQQQQLIKQKQQQVGQKEQQLTKQAQIINEKDTEIKQLQQRILVIGDELLKSRKLEDENKMHIEILKNKQDMITQLSTELQQKLLQNKKLDEELTALTNKYEELKAQNQQMSSDVEMLKQVSAEMDSQYHKLEELELQNKQCVQLFDKYREIMGEQLTEHSLAQRKQQESKGKAEIDHKNKLIEQIQEEKRKQLNEFRLQQEKHQKQILECKEKIECQQKIIEKLDHQLEPLKQQLELIEQQKAQAEQSLLTLRQSAKDSEDNYKKQLQNMKNKHNRMQKTISETGMTNQQLREKIMKLENSSVEGRACLQESNKKSEQKDSRIKSLEEEVGKLHKQIDKILVESAERVKAERTNGKRDIADYEQVHNVEKANLERKWAIELEAVKTQVRNSEKKVMEKENELRALNGKLIEQKKGSAMLSAKLEEMKSANLKIDNLESQNNDLKSKLLLKEQELKKAFNNISNFKSTIAELETGIEIYHSYVEQKSQEIQEIRQKYEKLQAEYFQQKRQKQQILSEFKQKSHLYQVMSSQSSIPPNQPNPAHRKNIITPIKRLLLKYFEQSASYTQKTNTLNTLCEVLELDKEEREIIKAYKKYKLALLEVSGQKQQAIESKFFEFLTSD